MKRVKLVGLILVAEFLVGTTNVKAETLTEEQVTRKIQCKNATSMDKEDLQECIDGKYELSRYLECGKAKIPESHFKSCLKNEFQIAKFQECRELFPQSTTTIFANCMKSNVSSEHKKICGNFNNSVLLHIRYNKDVSVNCMDESVEFNTLNACMKRLDDYKMSESSYYDDTTYSLNKLKGFFKSVYITNLWKDGNDYSQFINDCYKGDFQINKTCFDYFDNDESGDLKRVGKCMKYKTTKNDIKKCEEILNNTKDKDQIVDCLSEFYAAKVTQDSTEKVEEVLSTTKDEKLKANDKKLNSDKRNKNKGIVVNGSHENKVNGTSTKNH